MSNDETWQSPFEDDGITLGPEEALRREPRLALRG